MLPPRSRRWLLAVWILACVALVVLALIPPATGMTRMAVLGNLALAWGIGAWCWWSHRMVRMAVALPALVMLAVLLVPARSADTEALRARYCRRLHAHEGTLYVWGGEGFLGLDCSGLIRRAFIEANLIEGLRRCDAGAIRLSFWLWWNDQSARCLRDGGLGTTIAVGKAARLSEVEPGQVMPGDLAVTADGVHVLASLGGGRWIQASPDCERVIIVDRGGDDPWLHTPVHLMRWRALQGTTSQDAGTRP